MLLSDMMNIFHQQTRLSPPSKQGSNWQHQLRLASLYPWNIMMSALRHDQQRIFNQLPFLLKYFELVFLQLQLVNISCKLVIIW